MKSTYKNGLAVLAATVLGGAAPSGGKYEAWRKYDHIFEDHIVRNGETLTSIADAYDVTLDGLLSCNPTIKNPDGIREGQRIDIVRQYRVKKGETLVKIADAYRVFPQEIFAYNWGMKNPDHIGADTALRIPCRISFDFYQARKGDTLWKIARKSKTTITELMDANPQIRNKDVMKEGVYMRVPRKEWINMMKEERR